MFNKKNKREDMTRDEALAFLELPVSATQEEIKKKIAEKLAYFELQSEKAPSDFLRRLGLRNLGKVKSILKDSAPWVSSAPEPEELIPVVEVEEENAPTVYIVSSLKDAVLKKAETVEAIKPITRQPGEPSGWLIRHTEKQPATVYPLVKGRNFLGRKKQGTLHPFIIVEGDDFISRVQCVIYAEETDLFDFYISDPSAFTNGKTSSNGTFVNGISKPVISKLQLSDGDTIQVGMTKLVLRFNTGLPLHQIEEETTKSPFVSTVTITG